MNSGWVRKELKLALQVQKERGADSGYRSSRSCCRASRVGTGALVRRGTGGIKVTVGPGGIEQALPALFAALGEQLPDDLQPPEVREAVPVADLILELTDLGVSEIQPGVNRAAARAVLVFDPA